MNYKANNNQGINVLAGEIKENSTGVIITDYLAESIIFYDDNLDTYQDIVDAGFLYNSLDVDAVIESDAFSKYEEELKLNTLKDHTNVVLDIAYDYSVCYSLNPNFIADYKQYLYDNELGYTMIGNISLRSGRKIFSAERSSGYYVNDLKSDEIRLSYTFYNELFGTDLSKDDENGFTQATVSVKLYDIDNKNYLDKEFTIVGLYEQKHYGDAYRLSSEYFYEAADSTFVAWDIELFNVGNLYDLHEELLKSDCIEIYRDCRVVFRTSQLLSVFYEVFIFISLIMIMALFLIIILNASTIIRQNVYEIGVMKALGAKTSELVVIFTLQMVITCLGVCLLLYSCSNIFMSFANKLLCSGISAYVTFDVFYNVIVFSPKFFVINIVSISVFTILSIMVPILAIRNIKPLKIIKTRN